MALGLMAFHYLNAENKNCTLKIAGLVIDSFENSHLHNTLVSIEALKKESKTNNNGYFSLLGLCPGIYEIHVSHLNCEHFHFTLNLTADTTITIHLKHIEKELIGFKLNSRIDKASDQNNLNSKDLEKRKGQSISSLMQDIAGINLLKTGHTVSKPMVNGLFGNRVILINNGVRQEGQNWGMEHAPEIDAFLASEIELIKGAESLRYGADGIGGVILIKPKSIFSEKLKKLNGEINTIGNSNGRAAIGNIILGSLLSRKIPIYFRVQGSIKQAGNTKTANSFIANTGFSERNYSINLGFQKNAFRTELFYSEFHNQIGIYTGAQVGNLSDLELAMRSQTPLIKSKFSYRIDRPYQLVTHRLLVFRNSYQINAKNKLDLSLSYQKNHREEYDVLRSSNSFKGPSFDYYISSSIAELLWTKTNFHQINWKAGAVGLHQSNAYTGRFFIPGFYQKSIAGFFVATKNLKKTIIEGSVRYDQKQFEIFRWRGNVSNQSQLNYKGLAYVLKAEYSINEKQKLSLIHSSTWRPPGVNELYANGLHQGLASIEIGDSSLHKERSIGQSLTFTHSSKKHRFEAEVFYQRISGFINLTPSNTSLLTIRGAYPVFVYQQNKVALYGLNARWKYQLSKDFHSLLVLQVPFGQNLDKNTPLNMMPAVNSKLSIAYGKNNFKAEIWADYQAKQTRYLEGSDYLAPPPAYILIGCDINYAFTLFKKDFKFGLNGYNLSNKSYRNYLNRFRYFTDEMGVNISARLAMIIN
jgi:iron complex outermembrane receptor protein